MMQRIVLLVFFSIFVSFGVLAESLTLPAKLDKFSLGPYLEIYCTSENGFAVEELAAVKRFEKPGGNTLNFGFAEYPVWATLRLLNDAEWGRQVVFEVDSPVLDRADLYYRRAGHQWQHIDSGERVEQQQRQHKFFNPLFFLNFAPGEKIEIAMVCEDEGTVPLSLRIWDQELFEQHAYLQTGFYGVYYGILIAMLIYNLVLFFVIRDRVYIYYVAYVFFYAIFQFTDNGLTHYFFSDYLNHSDLNIVITLCCHLFIIALLLFARTINNTALYAPRSDLGLRALIGLFSFLVLSNFIFPYMWVAKVSVVGGFLVCFTVMLGSFVATIRGSKPARYFLVAFALFFSGAALWALRNAGFLEPSLWTDGAMQIGSAAEMMMLSMVLAYRINLLKQEKLEQEVLATKKYQAISENSPDAILRFNTAGELLYANQQTALLSCINKGKIADQDLNNVYGQFGETLRAVFGDIVEGVEVTDRVLDLGDVIEIRARAEYGIDDEIVSVIFLLRDVTEEHKLRQDLRQTEKMQAVGQLAGGVAHDFNNQLTIILGFADILATRCGLKGLALQATEKIALAARSSAALTSQLLAFARKGAVHAEPICFNYLVAQVASLAKRSMDKNIKIVEKLCTVDCIVEGDVAQLQNAILNLCINARDAMPDGGQITLVTEVVYGRVRLSVIDTGSGIPPEIREQIFEPFFTTKEVGKGTGMGLAAVFGTVETHGGTIDLESEVGRGTTFILNFPLSELRPEKEAPRAVARRGHGHILIIDDDRGVAELTKEIVGSLGYKVTHFTDGEEALDWYTDEHANIDVILLDMIMPEIDGLEAYKRIALINPDAKVVIVSGYALEGKAQEVLDLGANDFIQKPFTAADISQTLIKVIGI